MQQITLIVPQNHRINPLRHDVIVKITVAHKNNICLVFFTLIAIVRPAYNFGGGQSCFWIHVGLTLLNLEVSFFHYVLESSNWDYLIFKILVEISCETIWI